MPAGARGSRRGSFSRIPSTIRKMDKRKKAKTPPPPRISSRIRSSSPIRRSRSSRSTGASTLPRSPPKRRVSSSPVKTLTRNSREEIRMPMEPKRSPMPPKNRERTPEDKFGKKLGDGPNAEHHTQSYTKDDIKNLNIKIVPDYYNNKFGDNNYDSSCMFNRTFNPELVEVVRRKGEGARPIFDQLDIRKYDEFGEGPSHSDQMQFESSDNYNDGIRENPTRQYFVENEEDRNSRHSRQPPRDESNYRDERLRDFSRYQPSTSFDRPKNYPPERKDRVDERDVSRGPRRSMEGDRSRDRDRDRERERERERDRDKDKERERDRDRDREKDKDKDRDRDRERDRLREGDRDKDRERERERDRDRERERERERNRGRSAERMIRRRLSLSPRRHLGQNRDYENRRSRSLERRPRSPLERRGLERRSLERRPRSPLERRGLETRSLERKQRSPFERRGLERRSLERRPRSPLERRGVDRRSLERRPRSPMERRGLDRRSLERRPRSPIERRGLDRRSVERKCSDPCHHRHRDYSPSDRYSDGEHSGDNRRYYVDDGRDKSPPRRNCSHSRARGENVPGRPYFHFVPPILPMGPIRRPMPWGPMPWSPMSWVPMPRGPMPRGPIAPRRPPFDPRLARPGIRIVHVRPRPQH